MAKPLRVLLVEDSEDDSRLLLRELTRFGYEVSHRRVMSRGAFHTALREQDWDVVLADYSLPQFGAVEALTALRETGLDIPFIIASGTIGEETAVDALKAGAHDFVLKDRLARLVPAVERERREADLRAEQKRLREQLLISERMAAIGTLAAGVAHEINNPLAVALANLEVVLRDLQDSDSEIVEPLSDAREAILRVGQIVRDIKIFSRSADSERLVPVELCSVIDSSLRMGWNELRHQADIVKEYGEVPRVLANEGRLGQVLLNLIINAAQAISQGGKAQNEIRLVTATDSAGRAVVEVIDTGCGIPRERLQRIFDPFFTTKPVGVGTGLGLSICHRIVTELRGTIEVESVVGKGSRFRIVLPALETSVESRPKRALPGAASRRGSVLVVDDEPTIGAAISRALSDEHDVDVVTNAKQALRTIDQGKVYDVILCDLMMPEMSGMQFYAELTARHPEQAERTIFVTGGAFAPSARAFLESVPNQRCEKPFSLDELRSLVNERIR